MYGVEIRPKIAKSKYAYYLSVEAERGDNHRRSERRFDAALEKRKVRGEYCAIGSYFHINSNTALPADLVDEIAAVNDSMPTLTPAVRRDRMIRWLKWRLAALGFPGYHRRGKK